MLSNCSVVASRIGGDVVINSYNIGMLPAEATAFPTVSAMVRSVWFDGSVPALPGATTAGTRVCTLPVVSSTLQVFDSPNDTVEGASNSLPLITDAIFEELRPR